MRLLHKRMKWPRPPTPYHDENLWHEPNLWYDSILTVVWCHQFVFNTSKPQSACLLQENIPKWSSINHALFCWQQSVKKVFQKFFTFLFYRTIVMLVTQLQPDYWHSLSRIPKWNCMGTAAPVECNLSDAKPRAAYSFTGVFPTHKFPTSLLFQKENSWCTRILSLAVLSVKWSSVV